MTQSAFDSIVIGGRSACIAFATTTAAKLGERILMIKRAQLGSTCVNRGCLPKKTLWSAGQPARTTQAAASQDIATRTAIDYRPSIAKRDAHISDVRDTYARNLDDAGVMLVRGEATVNDAHSVDADGTTYRADQIILPVADASQRWTSPEQIFWATVTTCSAGPSDRTGSGLSVAARSDANLPQSFTRLALM
jgi:glutathione reductase (NADPH)